MARRYRFESTINAPRDLMLTMLTSCEFLEKEARENGAVDVTCRVKKRGKNKLSLEMRKTEPTLDNAGNVIEDKFEHIVLKQEWDLKKGTVDWSHVMEELEGVEVSGRNELRDIGKGKCVLVERGEISIRTDMPLVGRFMDWFIAGRVIAGMKAERARRAAYLARKAREKNS